MKNKDFKQKLIKEIVAILLLIVLVMFLICLLLKGENYTTLKMDEELRKMSSSFYEDYYYDDVSKGKSDEELKEFLKKYENVGLKVNLKNLLDYNEEYDDVIARFKLNGKECDKEYTKAVIYPKEPYKKSDYKIETIIDCQ